MKGGINLLVIPLTRIITKTLIIVQFLINTTQSFNHEKITMVNKIRIFAWILTFAIICEASVKYVGNFVYFLVIVPFIFIHIVMLKNTRHFLIVDYIFSYIVTSIGEFSATLIAKLIFSCTLYDILHTEIYLVYNILFAVISVITTLGICLYEEKRGSIVKEIIDNLTIADDLAIVISSAILVFVPFIHFYYFRPTCENHILLIFISQQFLLPSMLYLYFKYTNILSLARKKIHQEELRVKNLTEVTDALRTIKHDYNNILQSINGYVITKQYDALNDHMFNLIKESQKITALESINPSVINQPAIYGIIASKYYLTISKNIDFELSVSTNISSICTDFTKLSRILGILMDNAIEASEKSEKPHIKLCFSYNPKKNADIISISNTIKEGITIDTNSIFKKGYSSKKVKSGIGLWEVKKILAKEENAQIFPDVKNNVFSQTIVIEKS